MNTADIRKVKKLAGRLGTRDSDIIRFAVKTMLAKLAPLYDGEARGRNLVPVFVESGIELVRFFELDARGSSRSSTTAAERRAQRGARRHRADRDARRGGAVRGAQAERVVPRRIRLRARAASESRAAAPLPVRQVRLPKCTWPHTGLESAPPRKCAAHRMEAIMFEVTAPAQLDCCASRPRLLAAVRSAMAPAHADTILLERSGLIGGAETVVTPFSVPGAGTLTVTLTDLGWPTRLHDAVVRALRRYHRARPSERAGYADVHGRRRGQSVRTCLRCGRHAARSRFVFAARAVHARAVAERGCPAARRCRFVRGDARSTSARAGASGGSTAAGLTKRKKVRHAGRRATRTNPASSPAARRKWSNA